jgi:hypothetical protein
VTYSPNSFSISPKLISLAISDKMDNLRNLLYVGSSVLQ